MSESTPTDAVLLPLTALPPRPRNRGLILAGLLVIALFFGGFGAWAARVPLSSAVVAPGQVRVDSHRKTVQHLEGGIIHDLLVREGDEVAAGQVLMRLDDTQSTAEVELLRGQHDALKALEARLVAERDGAEAIAFPEDLAAHRGEPAVNAMLTGQETIFAGRRRTLLGRLAILRQRIEQLQAEIEGYRAQVASEEEQSSFIREEVEAVRTLYNKGLERKPRLLALEREAARLEGNRGERLAAIARAEQGIGEARLQMSNMVNSRADEVALELRDVQSKISDIDQKLRAAIDVAGRTEILAPQAGRVVNLRYFTTGGVVRAGEPILDIVPQDDALVVEAQVQPVDIDSLHGGLPAQITLSAFNQRTTPTLDGRVIDVSADSLTDERTGLQYYAARLVIDLDQLTRLEGVALYPGMPAEALIVTGERTALDYWIDPVRDSFRRAFREQ